MDSDGRTIPTSGQARLATQLAGINDVLMQISPLIGSSALLLRLIVAIAHRTGTDIQAFAQEIADHDAKLSSAQAAIDQFNAEHPQDPAADTDQG